MNNAKIRKTVMSALFEVLKQRAFDVDMFEILVRFPPPVDDMAFYERVCVEILGRSEVGMWRFEKTAIVDKGLTDASNVDKYVAGHFRAKLTQRLRYESEGVGLYLSLRRKQ